MIKRPYENIIQPIQLKSLQSTVVSFAADKEKIEQPVNSGSEAPTERKFVEASNHDKDSELSFLNVVHQGKEPTIEEYFLSNKERMMLIAQQKFDRSKDDMFFRYLENLTNGPQLQLEGTRGQVPRLIQEFVSAGHSRLQTDRSGESSQRKLNLDEKQFNSRLSLYEQQVLDQLYMKSQKREAVRGKQFIMMDPIMTSGEELFDQNININAKNYRVKKLHGINRKANHSIQDRLGRQSREENYQSSDYHYKYKQIFEKQQGKLLPKMNKNRSQAVVAFNQQVPSTTSKQVTSVVQLLDDNKPFKVEDTLSKDHKEKLFNQLLNNADVNRKVGNTSKQSQLTTDTRENLRVSKEIETESEEIDENFYTQQVKMIDEREALHAALNEMNKLSGMIDMIDQDSKSMSLAVSPNQRKLMQDFAVNFIQASNQPSLDVLDNSELVKKRTDSQVSLSKFDEIMQVEIDRERELNQSVEPKTQSPQLQFGQRNSEIERIANQSVELMNKEDLLVQESQLTNNMSMPQIQVKSNEQTPTRKMILNSMQKGVENELSSRYSIESGQIGHPIQQPRLQAGLKQHHGSLKNITLNFKGDPQKKTLVKARKTIDQTDGRRHQINLQRKPGPNDAAAEYNLQVFHQQLEHSLPASEDKPHDYRGRNHLSQLSKNLDSDHDRSKNIYSRYLDSRSVSSVRINDDSYRTGVRDQVYVNPHLTVNMINEMKEKRIDATGHDGNTYQDITVKRTASNYSQSHFEESSKQPLQRVEVYAGPASEIIEQTFYQKSNTDPQQDQVLNQHTNMLIQNNKDDISQMVIPRMNLDLHNQLRQRTAAELQMLRDRQIIENQGCLANVTSTQALAISNLNAKRYGQNMIQAQREHLATLLQSERQNKNSYYSTTQAYQSGDSTSTKGYKNSTSLPSILKPSNSDRFGVDRMFASNMQLKTSEYGLNRLNDLAMKSKMNYVRKNIEPFMPMPDSRQDTATQQSLDHMTNSTPPMVGMYSVQLADSSQEQTMTMMEMNNVLKEPSVAADSQKTVKAQRLIVGTLTKADLQKLESSSRKFQGIPKFLKQFYLDNDIQVSFISSQMQVVKPHSLREDLLKKSMDGDFQKNAKKYHGQQIINISKIARKYIIPHKLDMNVSSHEIKSQQDFMVRAYQDLLDQFSQNMLMQNEEEIRRHSLILKQQQKKEAQQTWTEKRVKQVDDQVGFNEQFKMMWTYDGKPLYTFDDLLVYAFMVTQQHQKRKLDAENSQTNDQITLTFGAENGIGLLSDTSGIETPLVILSQQRPKKNDLVLNEEQLAAVNTLKHKKHTTSFQLNEDESKSLESLRNQAMNVSISTMIDQQIEQNPQKQRQRNMMRTKKNMQMLSKRWHEKQLNIGNHNSYHKSTSSHKYAIALPNNHALHFESVGQLANLRATHMLKDQDRPFKLPGLPNTSSVRSQKMLMPSYQPDLSNQKDQRQDGHDWGPDVEVLSNESAAVRNQPKYEMFKLTKLEQGFNSPRKERLADKMHVESSLTKGPSQRSLESKVQLAIMQRRHSSLAQLTKKLQPPLSNGPSNKRQVVSLRKKLESDKLAEKAEDGANQPQKQIKKTMSYEEVKHWSEKFLLPSKVIYQLNSEFNCILQVLIDSKEKKAQVEDSRQQDNQKEADEEDPHDEDKKGLIPVEVFIEKTNELKDHTRPMQLRILRAIGINTGDNAVINWSQYLTVATILRYFTATKLRYQQFWLNFFDPLHHKKVPLRDIFVHLEALMRGVLTKESTLISEKFARSFCQTLKRHGCIVDGKSNQTSKQQGQDEQQKVASRRQKLNEQKAQLTALLKDGIRDSIRRTGMKPLESESSPHKPQIVDIDIVRQRLQKRKIDLEYLNQCFKRDDDLYLASSDDSDADDDLDLQLAKSSNSDDQSVNKDLQD